MPQSPQGTIQYEGFWSVESVLLCLCPIAIRNSTAFSVLLLLLLLSRLFLPLLKSLFHDHQLP